MACNEDIKDSTNREILTVIKDEGDSLKKYNNIEVKLELNVSSYGQESVLDEFCSVDIKIENNALENVSNEIKAEAKTELEEQSIVFSGFEKMEVCGDIFQIKCTESTRIW